MGFGADLINLGVGFLYFCFRILRFQVLGLGFFEGFWVGFSFDEGGR